VVGVDAAVEVVVFGETSFVPLEPQGGEQRPDCDADEELHDRGELMVPPLTRLA
jgi:hypothetical protein